MKDAAPSRRRKARGGGSARPVAVRVIGCGNADAGDDAAGLIAVRALRRRLAGHANHAGIEIVEAPTGMHVFDLLAGAGASVVVDAIHTGGRRRPGATIVVAVGPDGLPAEFARSVSTHGLGVADAISLASTLGSLPPTVFVGIQVAGVDPGALLSAEVAGAMPAFVQLVEEEVLRLLDRERS